MKREYTRPLSIVIRPIAGDMICDVIGTGSNPETSTNSSKFYDDEEAGGSSSIWDDSSEE